MSRVGDALRAHLETGATRICRCWAVTRLDGVEMGFTDHDKDLAFDGITFRAGAGLTARRLVQTTGLSVDNTEALGALSDAALREEDILAGRYDGAEVRAWLVDWADPAMRVMQFRGTLGEIARAGGAFQAELRGLAEALNQPRGRVYQRPCSAVLGDARCGLDLSGPGYVAEAAPDSVEERRVFFFSGIAGFSHRWFEQGVLTVLDGAAAGLRGTIKNDRDEAGSRRVELWQALRAGVAPGDRVRLTAGCDKRAETCRLKFGNLVNYRGFPHIPGEDWLLRSPAAGGNAPVASSGAQPAGEDG